MRSRIGASGDRCNSSAHATASLARVNAMTKLSPSPCSTGRTPPWAATRSRSASSNRANAAVISSGWLCHNRVDPSTSASSNVTVPAGSNSPMSTLHSVALMVASIGCHRPGIHPRNRVGFPARGSAISAVGPTMSRLGSAIVVSYPTRGDGHGTRPSSGTHGDQRGRGPLRRIAPGDRRHRAPRRRQLDGRRDRGTRGDRVHRVLRCRRGRTGGTAARRRPRPRFPNPAGGRQRRDDRDGRPHRCAAPG